MQKLLLVLIFCFSFSVSYANNPNINIQAGVGQIKLAQADILFPLKSAKNNIFYTDLNAATSNNNSHFLGIGFGERKIIDGDMLGFYGFINRARNNVDAFENNWWILNFGSEFITNEYGLRVNLYIPAGSDKKTRTTDSQNSASYVQSGLIYRDIYYTKYTQEAATGLDFDYSRKIKNILLHGGGYFFNFSEFSNIGGVFAGIALPIDNNFSIKFDTSYDNFKHSVSLLSLVYNFGANYDQKYDSRLTNKVERNFGTLYNAAGMAAKTGYENNITGRVNLGCAPLNLEGITPFGC